MPHEQSTPVADASETDYRLLIPFLAHTTVIQTLILIIRITTSYRAIELGLPVVWLGIIATGFAILPVFIALPVGRWIDRGNDAKACWIGAALIFVACIGFWLWPLSAMSNQLRMTGCVFSNYRDSRHDSLPTRAPDTQCGAKRTPVTKPEFLD